MEMLGRLTAFFPALVIAALASLPGAGEALANRHPETPSAERAASLQPPSSIEAANPPVLRVAPLIEQRWLEVFGDEPARHQAERIDAGVPPLHRLPTGPMYRRDI